MTDTLENVLQTTKAALENEVLHRSEGDLVIQRILEEYIQDLLQGKSEEFDRFLNFQNAQNLNYVEVKNFVTGIRYAIAEEVRTLSLELVTNLQANDLRFNKLSADVSKYLTILNNITLDSNQITLDNGELRAGAWTILSQARLWDLEILSKLRGLEGSVEDSIRDAIEEIQNQIPSTEETISRAIEELSNSPLINNLSDLLNQSIDKDIAFELELERQAQASADAAIELAATLRDEALARYNEILQFMDDEVQTRIDEIAKEVQARKDAIDFIAGELLERVDQDKAEYQTEMGLIASRIAEAEDGLTAEIQHRTDGDASVLNALNTYKVSNDSAITGLTTNLSNNVTKTNANTTLITGLTARMNTAETGIQSATTAAADAMTKATTAVNANSALSTRVDALAASITEGNGSEVDVNAFNALKAEVTSVQGVVTGLVEDVTALESNYTSVNNKVTSQGTAISTLNNKMATAENSISQSANDITLLKTDITTINSSLLTKVDSQAFSQLSSDVTELEGKYTTQAGLVTDLRGSLDTTIVNVSNAATAAQNAMNTAGSKGKVFFQNTAPPVAERLSQNLWIDTTGGNNTPKRWNGSAWVAVTDKVASDALAAANDATTLANTKADASAFNQLNQKVTVIDGKVSTNTNSITSLTGKISTVEGALATKLDSSALVNYYTKQQTDNKASEIAAGKVEEFNAGLVIGGSNLLFNSNFASEASSAAWSSNGGGYTKVTDPIYGSVVQTNLPNGLTHAWLKLENGVEYTYSAMIKPTNAISMSTGYPLHYHAGLNNMNQGKIQVLAKSHDVIPANTWTRIWIRFKLTSDANSFRPFIYGGSSNVIQLAWTQLEIGTKATDWTPNSSEVQNSIDANSTAIQNTNAEVERVDGRVTTTNSNVTALTGRVSTVEGAVATKADASALNSLTTRVDNAEGVNTSQGTAITSLQNTINHATTGLASKASSAALSVVDNKVTAANGRIDTTNSNVTTLSGRVSTVEGSLTTKADVSALNALTTRVNTAEGNISNQATSITNLTNTLTTTKNTADNALPQISASSNYKVFRNVLNYYYATSSSALALVIQTPITFTSKMFKVTIAGYNYSTNKSNINLEVSGYAYSGTSILEHGAINHGSFPLSVKLGVRNSKLVIILLRTAQNWAYPQFNVDAEIGYTAAPDTWKEGWSVTPMAEADFATNGITAIISPSTIDVPTTVTANASAISTLTSNVSNIEGTVSSHTNSLTQLTGELTTVKGTLTTKADVSALNSLTTRVSNAEGTISNQASSITSLNSSISAINDTITIKDTRNTNEPPSWYWANYPKKRIVEFKYTSVIGVNGFFGGTYCSLETVVPWNDSSGGQIIQTATSDVDPSLYVQRKSTGISTWGAWSQPIKDLRDGLAGKASASALSTLSTQVSTIDGKVTTQASQITTLTSDNNANKNALSVQAKVINGVKANYMVKMETNGVIGGFGIIQEATGAMGTVTTTFGVNANSFFIGPPSSNKKPFIVTTANQVVNGVKYPAGTYIDVALIANATIGTAKIEDLAVTTAKIGNGQITTAKIGDLQVETLKIKDWAVTKPFIYTDTTAMNGSTYTIVNSNWVERLAVTGSGFTPGSLVLLSLNSDLYITNRETPVNSGVYMSDAPRIALKINGVQNTIFCPRDEVIRIINSYGGYNLYVGQSSATLPGTLMYTAYADANGQVKASLLTRDGSGNNKPGTWGWISHSKTTWLMQEFKK